MDLDLDNYFDVNDTIELQARVEKMGQELGYPLYGIVRVQDNVDGTTTFTGYSNMTPEAEQELNDPARGKQDPVMQFVKRHSRPLLWNRLTYKEAGREHLWLEQANLGYRSGVISALHLPRGQHLLLGFDGDLDKLPSQAEATYKAGMLQLALAHIQNTLEKIDSAAIAGPHKVTLSARELECLKWTMEGKTAWEVGMILGIAERTVNQHVKAAMIAMDAGTKHLAVLKAMRLGLLG